MVAGRPLLRVPCPPWVVCSQSLRTPGSVWPPWSTPPLAPSLLTGNSQRIQTGMGKPVRGNPLKVSPKLGGRTSCSSRHLRKQVRAGGWIPEELLARAPAPPRAADLSVALPHPVPGPAALSKHRPDVQILRLCPGPSTARLAFLGNHW